MKNLIAILAALLLASPAFAQRIVTHGATDQTVYIRIIDSVDGTPETGVTSATSGLDLEYIRNRAAAVDLTESDLGSASASHSDGGIIHVGGGVYRVDPPDAAFASGVPSVTVTGTVTGMIVVPTTVQLAAFDLQTATQAVNVTQFGGTNGTFASGRPETNLTHIAGSSVSTSTAQLGVNVVNFGGIAGTFSSGRPEVNATHFAGTAVASATLNANVTQLSGDSTAADNAESFFDGTGYAGTGNTIPTVTTTTNLTNKGDGSGFTAIPWNASWDAEVQSEANDALVANNLDHLLLQAVSGTDVTDNSVIARMASKSATADWDTFVNTTDSLEAIRDNAGGGGGSMSWADLVADNDDTPGSFGKAIADIRTDTGTSIPDAIDDIDVGPAAPDARDLEPVAHTWQLKRTGDGTLRSENAWHVHPGDEALRGGWNCYIPAILPTNTVIGTQAEPELVTDSGDITITHIGHDGKVAKVELEIADDAEPGSHWIKTKITNSNGGGPVWIYGEVVIQAEPE